MCVLDGIGVTDFSCGSTACGVAGYGGETDRGGTKFGGHGTSLAGGLASCTVISGTSWADRGELESGRKLDGVGCRGGGCAAGVAALTLISDDCGDPEPGPNDEIGGCGVSLRDCAGGDSS